MQARLSEDTANPARLPGVGKALHDRVARIERSIDILDTDALDQLRDIMNRITTLELRVSGKFV